jgi:hypothetical protein
VSPLPRARISLASSGRSLRAAKRAGISRNEVLVRLNQREGTAVIYARSPGDPITPPQTTVEEWKLPDEPETEIRP